MKKSRKEANKPLQITQLQIVEVKLVLMILILMIFKIKQQVSRNDLQDIIIKIAVYYLMII